MNILVILSILTSSALASHNCFMKYHIDIKSAKLSDTLITSHRDSNIVVQGELDLNVWFKWTMYDEDGIRRPLNPVGEESKVYKQFLIAVNFNGKGVASLEKPDNTFIHLLNGQNDLFEMKEFDVLNDKTKLTGYFPRVNCYQQNFLTNIRGEYLVHKFNRGFFSNSVSGKLHLYLTLNLPTDNIEM